MEIGNSTPNLKQIREIYILNYSRTEFDPHRLMTQACSFCEYSSMYTQNQRCVIGDADQQFDARSQRTKISFLPVLSRNWNKIFTRKRLVQMTNTPWSPRSETWNRTFATFLPPPPLYFHCSLPLIFVSFVLSCCGTSPLVFFNSFHMLRIAHWCKIVWLYDVYLLISYWYLMASLSCSGWVWSAPTWTWPPCPPLYQRRPSF